MYFFFFYPLGTRPHPERLSPGCILLFLLLLAVYSIRFLDPVLYGQLVWASFRPSDPSLPGAVLSLLLHGGWAHLLGNALYLVIFGRQLEGRIGFPLTLSIFVLGGVAGCFAQGILTPTDAWSYHAPIIGASGGIAALLGATILRFHHTRVRILYFVFALLGGMTKGGVVYVNTVVATLAWFAFQVIYSLVAWGNGGASTAYVAHVGGFLVGVALAILLRLPAQARQEVHLERGQRYFETGNWYAAAGEFAEHIKQAGETDKVRALRARCFVLLGRAAEATKEYQAAFRAARRSGDVTAQGQLYREMRRYGIGTNLKEPALLRLAFDLQKAGCYQAAVDAYRDIETTHRNPATVELALIRRAELLWEKIGSLDEAKEAYARLLREFPDGDWRGLAEGRLRSMHVLSGEDRSARRSRAPSPGTSTRPEPASPHRWRTSSHRSPRRSPSR